MAGGVNLQKRRKPLTLTAPGKGDSQAPRPFSNSVNKSDNEAKQPKSTSSLKDNRSMTVGQKSNAPAMAVARKPAPSSNYAAAAPKKPAPTSNYTPGGTSDPKLSKSSTTPEYVSEGDKTVRGAVTSIVTAMAAPAARQGLQNRSQRDGLAMDSRRKKN